MIRTTFLLSSILVLLSVPLCSPIIAQIDTSSHAVAKDGYLGNLTFDGHAISDIESAADDFLATLTDTQLSLAHGDVTASSWTQWVATPVPRNEGVQLGTLSETQLIAAHKLLQSSLSPDGYHRVAGAILAEDTLTGGGGPGGGPGGGANFGSENYWLRIYGDPSADTKWGFQLEGHHLVRNIIVVGEQLTNTPSFIGIEPVPFELELDGVMTEQSPYSSLVSNAYSLVDSIGDPAIVGLRAINNVSEGVGIFDTSTLAAEGTAGADMTAEQKSMLMVLVDEYLGSMPEEYAAVQLAEVESSIDETYFSWRGGTTDPFAESFSIRVHGPDVFIEGRFNMGVGSSDFDHLHSILRDPKNDYGVGFAIPEPTSAITMALGLMASLMFRKRKRHAAA